MPAMSGFWFLLMTVVSILAKGNCQCSEDRTRNSETSRHCNQIYAALESALVSTDNLYVLRIALYPTSQFNPRLLEVEYDIRLPDNGTFTTTLGWTDSGVFAAINPRTLFNLQLRILYLPLRNVLLVPDTITLTLDAQNSEVLSNATTDDIADVLGILNARLLVYATTQAALTDWDGSDTGYTWNGQNEKNPLLPLVVFLTIPAVVIILPLLYFIFHKELDEIIKLVTYLLFFHREIDESNSLNLHVLLYSLEIPAAILTCIECVTSFLLFTDCQRFSCFVRAITAIAIFIIALLFKLPVCSWCSARWNNRQFIFRWKFISNFVFLKALAAVTYISIIPLILLIAVYPAMMLCTIIIYFSVITLSAVLLSPLGWCLSRRANSKQEPESNQQDKRANRLQEQGNDGLEEPNLQEEQGDNGEWILEQKWQDSGLKKRVKEKYRQVKETVTDKCQENSRTIRGILLILIISFVASLSAMLLSLLLLQALLAGATSNTILNFVLIVVTAFVPGGVLYIIGKTLKNLKFQEGDDVYVVSKKEENVEMKTNGEEQVDGRMVKQVKLGETNGPYKLKRKVDDARCVIETKEDKREYIVDIEDLLKNPVPRLPKT